MPGELQVTSAVMAAAPTAAMRIIDGLSVAYKQFGNIAEVNDNRLSHFIGHTAHESAGYTRMQENLYYTPERLMAVWPSRFNTYDKAKQYARNPEKLANYVYGGRMGNYSPGDGWKFRGRGPLQLTGKTNYGLLSDLTGYDLLAEPELAADPIKGFIIGWAYFDSRRLRVGSEVLTVHGWADRDNIEATTRAINGGLNGLEDRRNRITLAKSALSSKYPTLKLKDEGNLVILMQTRLVQHGFDIHVDGDFGPLTEKAVKKFQYTSGLIDDGIVGPNTWNALMGGVRAV